MPQMSNLIVCLQFFY